MTVDTEDVVGRMEREAVRVARASREVQVWMDRAPKRVDVTNSARWQLAEQYMQAVDLWLLAERDESDRALLAVSIAHQKWQVAAEPMRDATKRFLSGFWHRCPDNARAYVDVMFAANDQYDVHSPESPHTAVFDTLMRKCEQLLRMPNVK